MQPNSQEPQPILIHRIRLPRRQRADKGIKVVNPARTHARHIAEARAAEDIQAATREREALWPNAQGRGKGVRARLSVEGLRGLRAGCYCYGAAGFEHGDDEDGVREGLVAVWAADEVVAAGVVGARRASVGGVAVDGAEGGAVPVDELVLGDEFIIVGFAGLEGPDEGFCHLKPAVVGPFDLYISRLPFRVLGVYSTHISFAHFDAPSS